MANLVTAKETLAPPASGSTLAVSEAYGIAILCVLMGLVIGYLIPQPRSAAPGAQAKVPQATTHPHPGSAIAPGSMHVPSLEEMRHMADEQAKPLLAQLQANPRNSEVLAQLGALYHKTHQFKTAGDYYARAVAIDGKNVMLRNKLASSLYRSGDVDGALAQLDRALRLEPHDANALFNLGMIRLQGKHDGEGAVAAWQQLLKTNPQLAADRKAEVQKMMADVLTSLGSKYHPAAVRN